MGIVKSENFGTVNGTLLELNLERVSTEREINGKKVKCEVIQKADWKNATLTVDVGGKPIGVEYFSTYSINNKGEKNDKGFEAMNTVLEKYIPKSKETDERKATRVKCNGSLNLNDYINKDGELSSSLQFSGAFQPTSTGVSEDDFADVSVSGVVKSIKQEMKNEEETGRIIVEFYTFKYKTADEVELMPITFVVESDLAEEFEDSYPVGTSAKVYLEAKVISVGKKVVSTGGGIGRRDTKVQSGYEVTEWSLFSADAPYEEEHDLYIDPKDVKAYVEAREVKVEALKQKKKEKEAEAKKGGSSKKEGLGSRTSKAESKPMDDDENPFA